MFRVVIADDEKYIVQLIRALIDCGRLGVCVVGEASDGAQALELIQTLKPDILITDIRMPSMDGLELIEKIRETGLDVAVIAISGHRRFDYAISAIKYGVEDFIVKPINERELNGAIEKVCVRLQGEKSATEQIKTLSEQATRDVGTLRAKLLTDLMAGTVEDAPLEEINRQYHMHFEKGAFTGMTIVLDGVNAPGKDGHIIEKCHKAVIEKLKDASAETECIAFDGALLCLVNTDGGQTPHLLVAVKKLFEHLLIELDLYDKITISIGLGPSVGFQDAAGSLALSAKCVRAKMILGGQRILSSDKLNMEDRFQQIPEAHAHALRALMENHDLNQIEAWVDGAFPQDEAHYRVRPIEAVALSDSVVSRFRGLLGALGIEEKSAEAEKKRWAIGQAQSLSEIKDRIAGYMLLVLKSDLAQRAQREAIPVMHAKAYIEKHLGDSVRLEDIAGEVALSPGYFSVLFKKETGETVSDYLLRQRLEEAKRLLRTTSLNMNEIAERVGYTDAKHFSKMFKKQTGAKPFEYRKLYAW